MKLDELDEMMDNPQLIPGIYNYCDRWCERCPFTARCLTFAMEARRKKKRGKSTAHTSIENEEFWEEVEDVFQTTISLIRQMAEEAGVDLDNLEVTAEMEIDEERFEAAQRHALAERSMSYIEMVDEWFKATEAFFRQKRLLLESMERMNISSINVESEVEAINDLVEVVRWYQIFIHVKLQRAVHSRMDEDAEEEEGMSAFPKDSDGTAKVALIAMDRSIGAWGQLLKYFPQKETETLELLVHLDRLRRATEQEFPDARQFVRPGLDTISLLED